MSSLQEASGESICSAKSFTSRLSWSSNLQLQGSHFRRCVTLIAWVSQLNMRLRFSAKPASGVQPWDNQDQDVLNLWDGHALHVSMELFPGLQALVPPNMGWWSGHCSMEMQPSPEVCHVLLSTQLIAKEKLLLCGTFQTSSHVSLSACRGVDCSGS